MSIRGEQKRKTRSARLRELNERHTFEEMARRLGGNANPRYLSQIANEYLGAGRKTPRSLSDDYASRLERAFGLPAGWFDRPPGETNEQPGTYHTNTADGPIITARVPLISWTSAGNWAEIADHHTATDDWIATTVNVGPNAFALRIRGESMLPTIPDGAAVIVDPDTQYRHRSIVIVRQNGDNEATCKRLIYEGDTPMIRPDNPAYASQIAPLAPDAVIVGVVRQVIIDLD